MLASAWTRPVSMLLLCSLLASLTGCSGAGAQPRFAGGEDDLPEIRRGDEVILYLKDGRTVRGVVRRVTEAGLRVDGSWVEWDAVEAAYARPGRDDTLVEAVLAGVLTVVVGVGLFVLVAIAHAQP